MKTFIKFPKRFIKIKFLQLYFFLAYEKFDRRVNRIMKRKGSSKYWCSGERESIIQHHFHILDEIEMKRESLERELVLLSLA